MGFAGCVIPGGWFLQLIILCAGFWVFRLGLGAELTWRCLFGLVCLGA